jgi:RimJ/RimL family protein N-acetyltransferase
MSGTTSLRTLTASDVSEFVRLRLEAVKNAPVAFHESVQEVKNRSPEQNTDILSDHGRGDFVMGAFDAESLVGMAGFSRAVPEKTAHKGTIWGVYVSPQYRQQGIGAALLEAVVDRAFNELGIKQIMLGVAAQSTGANRLYEAAGFRRFGVELLICTES